VLEWLLPPEPVQADLLVEDGASFAELGLPARVLHTPGHTPGSSCLITEGGLAFAGDLVSTTGGPHSQRYFADNWKLVGESLKRLQEAAPKLAYPGHGRRPLTGDEVAGLQLETQSPELPV
jgi:hydroxyacylglutathione hydrolase